MLFRALHNGMKDYVGVKWYTDGEFMDKKLLLINGQNRRFKAKVYGQEDEGFTPYHVFKVEYGKK